jgi:hypothetical protein
VNFATIRAALKVAAIAASGLSSTGAVEWKGTAASSAYRPLIRCDMSLRSIRGVGNDEVRREYDADTDALVLTVCGNRAATWTLRFETQDGSDSGIAMTYAMRAMARLQRPTVLETLRESGVAVANFQAVQTFDNVKLQDRVISVAVLDVNLNLAENDTDDASDSDFIESAQIDGDTIDHPDGTPLTNQPSILVET